MGKDGVKQRRRRGGRLTGVVVSLALTCVVSGALGAWLADRAYERRLVDFVLLEHLDHARSIVRCLSAFVKPRGDLSFEETVALAWRETEASYQTVDISIISLDGHVLVDTGDPHDVGRSVGGYQLLGVGRQPSTILDVLGAHEDFTGLQRQPGGSDVLAAYAFEPRVGLVGVHARMDRLEGEIEGLAMPWIGALAGLAGFMLPLALVVLHRGWRTVQAASESERLLERATEAELAHADRLAAVSLIATGLAHEINNPLTYVLGNLDFVETHLKDAPPSVAGLLRDAREGAERIARVVADLRSFGRLDEPTRLEPVDVNDALERALRLVGPPLRHQARITRRYGKVPLVLANEGCLVQIFMNLLVNASQALPPNAMHENEVNLETFASGGMVWVHIRDTGAGLTEEAKAHLFEPFFTTRAPGVGAGLGLFMTRSLVESLGGTLSFESEAGHGTTATVGLQPSQRAEHLAGERSGRSVDRDARPRVLFVDDEENLVRLFEATLGDRYDVVVETSGRSAADRLEADADFDAIVCDLMMPEVDGVEVFERARRAHPEVAERFLFTTGGAFTDRARAFVDSISNPCVEKPFKFSDIDALIRTRIAETRMNRA